MAPSFVACDREQSFLMPPDVREWLPEDHFAWFVLEAVEAMDLDVFYAAYRSDGHARLAFDSAVMAGAQPAVATRFVPVTLGVGRDDQGCRATRLSSWRLARRAGRNG